MTTNDKGNIGLAKVISDFTEKLYQVFLPLTDTSIIDLIIVNKELVSKKIQIKYLSLSKIGSLLIQCESVINGKRILNDFSKIDGIAIYCSDNKQIYYYYIPEIRDYIPDIRYCINCNKSGRFCFIDGLGIKTTKPFGFIGITDQLLDMKLLEILEVD